MSSGAKAFVGLMLTIAAVMFIVGIWTNDERWGGTGFIVMILGIVPWASWQMRH